MTDVVVFAGPSLSQEARSLARSCELLPPIQRGQLDALTRRPQAGTAVLLDGLFGSALAVTPTECRDAIGSGWTLVGASSIGALRASELWSLGMIGIGRVYELLRLGHIESDAELAVGYHPDTFEEITVSLVHVRALLDASLGGVGQRPAYEAALERARGIYWAERSWRTLCAAWRSAGLDSELLAAADAESKASLHHPKHRDAELALRAVLNQTLQTSVVSTKP